MHERGTSEVRRKPGEASISRRKRPFVWEATKRQNKMRTEKWPLDLAV